MLILHNSGPNTQTKLLASHSTLKHLPILYTESMNQTRTCFVIQKYYVRSLHKLYFLSV